ncbi:MAG: hypothetical protein HC898_02485 [Phycisphaerales bacterium]|nr:hypothetical protein [Phycisphaerales bacterium]
MNSAKGGHRDRRSHKSGLHWLQKLAIAVAALVVVGILLLGVGGVVLYQMWKSPPAHWQRYQTWLQTTTPEARKELATSLEKRILEKLSQRSSGRIRNQSGGNLLSSADQQQDALADDQPLEFELTVEEANAWLEQRLPEILANQNMQLPDGISGMMVDVDNNDLLLSFHYKNAKVDQVFTLVTQPVFSASAQGSMQMSFNLQSLRGGRMPIPGGVVDRATKELDQKSLDKAVESVMATLRGKAFDATIPHPADPKQKIRITDLAIKNGALSLQTQVEGK